ncbi:MAG: sulfur oxidation c-type cytochrome SoxA [Sulfurimicrobium sp.]
MRKPIILASLALAAIAGGAAAAEKPYRDMIPYIDYSNPAASGDAKHTNTYQYWKDRDKLDPARVTSGQLNWTTNWKFMDAPYNDTLHGGYVAQDRGEELFKRLNATGAFAACLGARNNDLKGLRLQYPQFREDMKRVVGMEAMIEQCAEKQGMKLENGSYDNSAVSIYISAFSNGMPIKIDVSKGPLKESFEHGKELFHTRVGWTNFACATCHVNLVGKSLRGQTPTTHFGDASHWPTYRTKDELQSLHVRFTECNRNAGTQPLKIGSQEYTDIEVFLTALTNGYPVSLPSARD